jgi:hypothetical protein
LKEGKVVVCGDYSEVVKTGFNIKDILDSFNKALKAQDAKDAKPEKDAKEIKPEKEWADKCKVEDAPKWAPEKEATEKCPVPEPMKEDLAIKLKPSDVVLTSPETEHPPVSFQDWRNFFSFSSGMPGMIVFAIIAIATSVMQMAPTYVMSIWSALPLEEQ